MAWHFASLKVALLTSAFKRGWQQGVGLAVGVLVGIPFGLTMAAALAATGSHPVGGALLVIVFTSLAVVWAVGPLLLFGLDETLDPARLRLLPLSRRQLVTGLLASSAIGIGPLVTALILGGAILGFAPRGIGAILVVAGVLVQLVLCLVLARALTTALSARLRSRKGRDVLAMLTVLIGVGFAFLGQVPRILADMDIEDPWPYVQGAADAIRWLPTAWAAHAIVAAHDERVLAAVAWLVAAAGVVAALAAWWARSLHTAATTAEDSGGATDADADLFPPLVGFLPATRWGATAAKELRYQWRVPQLRANWLMFIVMSAGLVIASLFVDALDTPRVVLAPTAVGALQAFTSLNAFGGDRAAVWMLVGGGGIGRADLAGKNAATGLITLTVVLASATVLALLTGGWTYLPLTAAATLAVLGIVYGVGNVASVIAPTPLPESGQNMFASSAGTGCMTALLQMVAWFASSIVALPAVAAVGAALLLRPSLLPLAALLAVVYGAGVWWCGLVISANFGRSNGPRILDALSG